MTAPPSALVAQQTLRLGVVDAFTQLVDGEVGHGGVGLTKSLLVQAEARVVDTALLAGGHLGNLGDNNTQIIDGIVYNSGATR